MTTKFKTGDLVWAKLRFSPFWPAKVVDPPDGTDKKNKKNSSYVFFYGSENFAWVPNQDICSYKDNIKLQVNLRSAVYRRAVQTIARIYHEEVQLNSPTFKRFYKKEKEEEEEVDTDDEIQSSPTIKQGYKNEEDETDVEVKQNDYESITKPKRTEKEQEERQKKIQHRLRVRLFTKKNKKTRKQRKTKKVSDNEDAENIIPSPPSSCIPSSSSSCIITVHVSDFRKVIPYEAVVLLQRCDEVLPSLTLDSEEPESTLPSLTLDSEEPESTLPSLTLDSEEPESTCQEDQPPTLLPEL